jgi:hypothetical protein
VEKYSVGLGRQSKAGDRVNTNLRESKKNTLPNSLTTRGVFTPATDFHHAGFFSFFAVLAAKLTAFLGRTVTCAVRAFSGCFFSHFRKPPQEKLSQEEGAIRFGG